MKPKLVLIRCAAISLLLFAYTAANADTTAPTPVVKPAVTNSILHVRLESELNPKDTTAPIKVEFEKRVVVYVTGSSDAFQNSANDRIYINDVKMPYPVVFNCPCVNAKDPSQQSFTLTFTIGKHDTSWNKWYSFGDTTIAVRLDAGTKDKVITCSTDNNLTVHMYKGGSLQFSAVIVGLFFLLSIFAAFFRKSMLIRDRSNATKKPYSLSRFQLLWWSFIIISCYILLFAIRDDFGLLSQSTLILLGISAAGTGFAQLVDYSDADKDRHQDDESQGFLVDILSDDNGISIHRYQNLVFTLVFGIVFVYKVLSTGNMPDFGVLELSLMGLSTATYVGIKANENKQAAASAPAATANQNIVG